MRKISVFSAEEIPYLVLLPSADETSLHLTEWRITLCAVPLNIRTRKAGESTVVDVEGRIVFGEECERLRTQVREAISTSPSVIVNLRGVPYIDSGGVGCLVGLFTTAHNQGKALKFACGSEKVQNVLRITKLLPIVGMFTDEESAILSCQRKATA